VMSALGLSNARFCAALRYSTLGCAIYVMPSDATNSSDYAGSRTALPTLYELGPPAVSSVLFHFHPLIRSFRPGYIALKSKSCDLSKSVSVQLFPGHNYEKKNIHLSQLVLPSQYIQFLTWYICHRSTPLQIPWPRLCRVNLHVLSSALRLNSY
jgi:hypothetical protein